ncbi:TIGR03985 family CRISPR-associated protein [Tychonema sp. LEGE 07203]|uniref:TIGR03985 family CRISPR-associated protein n=1 Tax=Tychonema sp. LEGE 07203 TaxID=1828671 RepID=UPI00187EB0D6|nr:TIGR03985 family CRISPR-associated protein [Tychonema sp. LEGE 07203]
MNQTFPHPPNPKILQQLANGSLDQMQNLTRALRLWVLLTWLYTDEGYNALANSFTYTDWRKAFFGENYKDEKQEDIANYPDPNCACNITAQQWLLKWDLPVNEWRQSLQKQIAIADLELDELLAEKLFAQVRKSLQNDFDLLVSRNWLRRVSDAGRSKNYCRLETTPSILDRLENSNTESNLSYKAQIYLDMFSFLDPSLPLLAEQVSAAGDEDNHRVFLYVDYLVPESSSLEDAVEQFQSELQEIWDSGNITPLLLTYRSAHQNLIKECVVYPVCIYFMERAKYLCAYGSTPKGDINWYKYRLDRIISKRIEPLDWQDTRVPQLLKEKYQENNLPTPKTVNDMLKEAWGCDFYKETALMVLRFDRTFAQSYLQGISIHHTCRAIDCDRAARLIAQYTPNPEERSALLEILQSRPTDDAYYQVTYRVTDYYPLRWLRALGSQVEILLPWDLRQKIAADIKKTANLYQ